MRTCQTFFAALLLSLCSLLPAHADDSLYRALGEREGIARFLDIFVQLVQNDERIKHQFKETNFDLLARQLNTQICQLAGGPCQYGGDDMKKVHKGMGIDELQFNALAEDLQTAMMQAGVPASAQNKLLAKLAPMHKDIVSK
ncbi:group 1 truncated hemoglobin [Massilia sp. W12]|uniref:group I truncated hemoglobin n=1 Tax=Massilia sp. W12 TaxID=3126507 RepID=UPI0030D2685A